MRYELVQLDIADLPERLPIPEGAGGLGIVFRDQDRIVGFRLVDVGEMGSDGACAPAALVDRETRIAATAGRLRDEFAAGGRQAEPPTITVAICSKDRWEWVDRLLASLEADRDDDAVEVLVVENAPAGDRMREVCTARGVRYVAEPLVGLNFARSRALAEASGEVIAFLDDDVTVDRMWLKGLRRAWAENPDADCITGLVLPMALETEAQILFERAGGFQRGFRSLRFGAARFGDPLHPCGAGKFGAGANMSLRRKPVLGLGGFDEALDTGRPLPGGGDLDIFYRVLRGGAMLVYEPQVVVYHEHRRELEQLRRQYYTWGLGMMAFVTKSIGSDPSLRGRFLWLIAWWFRWQAKRLVRRMLGREPTPAGMILREIWGGLVGLAGEYRRSVWRSAAIRRRAA